MRSTIVLLVLVAFAVLMTAGSAIAQTEKIVVSEKISGNVTPYFIDMDGQGPTSDLGMCGGTGTLGNYTCNTLVEVTEPPAPASGDGCPEGMGRFSRYIRGGHVQRFENADLLYWVPVSKEEDPDGNYVCLSPSVPGAFIVNTFRYVGGTGRFEGATGATVMKVNVVTIAQDDDGNGVLFAVSGTTEGTVEVPLPENQAPVAVIMPDKQTVLTRQIQLDGSKSFDPDDDQITYSWQVIGRPAALMKWDTATPIIQFGSGRGDYTFELTVTDSRGLSSKKTTTVMYVGL